MPGPNQGNYSRFMFDEEKRYVYPMYQRSFPGVDADFNDGHPSFFTQLRRAIAYGVGDGSPNDGFEVVQATSTSNNFGVKGGDGTLEGAGRLFFAGYHCFLKSDVDYVSTSTDIHPQSYLLSETTLTDSSANWTINELAGRNLTPDITAPGNTYAIVSNTTTVITVVGGSQMVTDGAVAGDFYRVELSTSGAPRSDEVYVDVFLDEITETEDPNLIHPSLIPPTVSAYRAQLRQNVRVTEGGTTPTGPFTDADGRLHYYYKIATIARTATPNILTAMITDDRQVFNPGGGGIILKEIDGTPTIPGVNEIRVNNGSLTDLGSGVGLLDLNNLTVEEEDGTPSEPHISKIVVPRSSMTVLAPGEVKIETGGVSTGPTSRGVYFTNDISGVTPTSAGTTGTDIDTLDYPPGATETGQRFTFTIPEDYDSGDLEIGVVYRMSGTDGNDIRVRHQAKIVDQVTGGIDSTSYPLTNLDLSVPADTSITSDTLLTLSDGDFNRGDMIQAYVRRDPGSEAPANADTWKAIQFYYVYFGQIATRVMTVPAKAFDDYLSETAPASGSIGTDIDTLDFSPTVDNSQKTQFQVPASWGGESGAYLFLSYAMSTMEASKQCRFQIGGEITNLSAGTVDTIPLQEVLIYPANITADAPQDQVFVLSIPPTSMHVGDSITLYVRRKGSDATGDTHNGLFRLIHGYMTFGQAPSSGFTSVDVFEYYMDFAGFGTASGTISGSMGYPDYSNPGSDGFEGLWVIASSSAGATLPISFAGRLSSSQTTISSIKIPLRASASGCQYTIRVYVDGYDATDQFGEGIQTLTVTDLIERTILDVDLTNSVPLGPKKRFFVDVLATLDSGETLYVGRPFVRQE